MITIGKQINSKNHPINHIHLKSKQDITRQHSIKDKSADSTMQQQSSMQSQQSIHRRRRQLVDRRGVANSHHPITDPQPTDRFAASFSSDAAAAEDGNLWTAVKEYQ
jgi:hypothetical protein